MSETRFRIGQEADIHVATLEAHNQFVELGASEVVALKFRTAVSELTRNILKYAGQGYVKFTAIHENGRHGIRAVVADRGPGIPDIDAALQDSFSTSGTLGMGLPGVRRMVDSFAISSEVGVGTRVTIEVWI